MAASGILLREVVPSVVTIGRSLAELLFQPDLKVHVHYVEREIRRRRHKTARGAAHPNAGPTLRCARRGYERSSTYQFEELSSFDYTHPHAKV